MDSLSKKRRGRRRLVKIRELHGRGTAVLTERRRAQLPGSQPPFTVLAPAPQQRPRPCAKPALRPEQRRHLASGIPRTALRTAAQGDRAGCLRLDAPRCGRPGTCARLRGRVWGRVRGHVWGRVWGCVRGRVWGHVRGRVPGLQDPCREGGLAARDPPGKLLGDRGNSDDDTTVITLL